MRILVHLGEDTTDTTLEAFLEVNSDEFGPEDAAAIRATLEAGRIYNGGGGASGEWSVEVVQ